MLKFLLFILLAPFKNRTIGFITLFIGLTLFFRYFELQPSGEKKELNIGPMTFHVNSVAIHRRVAKPIVESGSDVQPAQPVAADPYNAFVSQPLDQPGTDDLSAPLLPDDNSFAIAPLEPAPLDPAPIDPAPASAPSRPVRQTVSYGTTAPSARAFRETYIVPLLIVV